MNTLKQDPADTHCIFLTNCTEEEYWAEMNAAISLEAADLNEFYVYV